MTSSKQTASITTELQQCASALRKIGIQGLSAGDPSRYGTLHRSACGLDLDFSRQLIDTGALTALLALARAVDLRAAMRALQGGEDVNATERRPALHTALRGPEGAHSEVDAARERMREWADALRNGRHSGFLGEPITDVVNIGIGGSDLGPRLVAEALGDPTAQPRCHFVANVDPDDLQQCLSRLTPARTLFIICSKSFRTEETRVNALAAREWLMRAGATTETIGDHFIAVSSNLVAAAEFGVPEANCLPMWDWVGGRFSLWSAVGLSAAIAIGWNSFSELLRGAAAMDAHTLESGEGDNLPLLCALLDHWNSNFLGAPTLAVLPYAQRLRKLPDFLQQLVMESNGKRVTVTGETLTCHSAPVLWGAAGTIGQHSFHQLLHQGTRDTAMELVLPLTNPRDPQQHARVVAHCLAQSSVFATGRSRADSEAELLARGEAPERSAALSAHLEMPGNRQHSLLSFEALTPHTLGALLALWEHRTYYNACLLGINAFDQWGVELGKVVSGQIQRAMHGDDVELDALTQRLLARWREVGGSV